MFNEVPRDRPAATGAVECSATPLPVNVAKRECTELPMCSPPTGLAADEASAFASGVGGRRNVAPSISWRARFFAQCQQEITADLDLAVSVFDEDRRAVAARSRSHTQQRPRRPVLLARLARH